jgi:hypothetical protein
MNKIDVIPLFDWAVNNGDANIIQRIMAKNLPLLIANDFCISEEKIANSETLEVSEDIYQKIKSSTEDLVGAKYV